MTRRTVSGAQAMAEAAVAAGVSLVTGYPGAPATAVVNAILAQTEPGAVQVEWTSNEKVALEMAFGASVGGRRAILCVKSVGLNIALDPLMVINLSGCSAGLVILVGDDPGSWGSQNEQDSRALGMAAELPVLEPATVPDAYYAVGWALAQSEELGLPVMVRFTRALALGMAEISADLRLPPPAEPPPYRREFMRWVVLPVNAIPLHRRLLQKLATLQGRFATLPLNGVHGGGARAIIAAGYAYQKLVDLVGQAPDGLTVFRLGTFHPLPVTPAGTGGGQPSPLSAFLQRASSVLVLEETAPLAERAIRAAAQAAGLTLPVYGRDTGHVPAAGELFAAEIAAALNTAWPELDLHAGGDSGRPRPSREPLCEGCPYVPTFDALSQIMETEGGRESYVVVGEPGCMVRSQLPPYELMDIKHSLGASIGMAAGMALSNTGVRVVAISGDSAFLHTGLNGLIDAVCTGARMTLLILDNSTTALSGGQPHPGSRLDARGQPRRAVELVELAGAAGASQVQVVELDAGEDPAGPIRAAIGSEGVAVVIARGRCPRWLPAA